MLIGDAPVPGMRGETDAVPGFRLFFHGHKSLQFLFFECFHRVIQGDGAFRAVHRPDLTVDVDPLFPERGDQCVIIDSQLPQRPAAGGIAHCVFVQIGLAANSAAFRGVVEMNRFGEIGIDSHCRTNVPGIYAAGDVSTVPYKQIIIAMGEGAKAALSAFEDRVRGII